MATTGIIIVNYNGTTDTIECLQSLYSLSSNDFNVYLIDNGSSLENFEDYLIRIKKISARFKEVQALVDIATSNRTDLINKYFNTQQTSDHLSNEPTEHPVLFLIFNETNKGFAAANNQGILLAQKLNAAYFWLLNNDTVLESDSLNALIRFSELIKSENQQPGLIGSKVLFYNNQNTIQTIGGIFNPFTSRQYHKGHKEKDNGQYDHAEVKINYPYGASIFFDTNFLNEVGLMNEKYFLYFEELDWSVRAMRKGFESRFCFESRVFHKQGNATGKKMNKTRSPFNTCLKSRNLLLFYTQHYFTLLPVAWLRLLLNAIKAFIKNDFEEAKMITRVLFGFRNCFLIQQKND